MAYNNIFPMGYQYAAPQGAYSPPSTPVAAPQQPQGNMIWVSGEAGAKAYLVAPNTTVQLWDSEAQTIYLKSADSSGMPTMKILDYQIRDNAPAQAPAVAMPMPSPEYVTKDEFAEFAAKIEKRLNGNRGNDNKRREEKNDG